MSESSQSGSNKNLLRSVLIAAMVGALLLVAVILPAEYDIDPLGLGGLLGLSAMNSTPTRTIEITDVIGGNERVTEVEIPDFGDPVPLPNPAIHQDLSLIHI